MKRLLIIALIVILALAAGFGACYGLYVLHADFRMWVRQTFCGDLPFDSAAWREGDAVARGRMLWSLRDQGAPMFHTRDGVVALLGEPDGRRFNDCLWFYTVVTDDDDLGPRHQYLVLKFLRYKDDPPGQHPRAVGVISVRSTSLPEEP
ncbi:MAG: hypothetical protein ACYTFO_03680 [Planctomycetota bacterium]